MTFIGVGESHFDIVSSLRYGLLRECAWLKHVPFSWERGLGCLWLYEKKHVLFGDAVWLKVMSVVTKLTKGGQGLRFSRALVKHPVQQPLAFLEEVSIGDMEAHCDPSTWEGKIRGPRIQSPPWYMVSSRPV